MKKINCLCFVLLLGSPVLAQLIKEIGRGIKKDAEWRIERKARDAINKSLDSLEKKAKTKKEEKKQSEQKNKSGTTAGTVTSAINEAPEETPEGAEGFIMLRLSTPVTTIGLTVTISGASIKYGKWNSVNIKVKKPNDEEELTVPLSDSGKYNILYDKLNIDGDYIITATSSDGKAVASERLKVNDVYQPQDETKDLMDAVGEAFNRLKKKEEALQSFLSAKDKAALQGKVKDVKEKADGLNKVLADIKNAKREIGDLYKAGKKPSKNIRAHLSALNDMITAKTNEVKKISDAAAHEPFDITVCEYIAMLNEACAAFSTFTNVWANSIAGIIKNIMLDKVVPKAVETAMPDMVTKNEAAGNELIWGTKEASKIFATAKFDMEGLTGKLGKAGFAGDVIQFATDVLMKEHCGVFKGTVKHYYNYTATNSKGVTWWGYSYRTESELILRYPKSSNGIIKMKGTIEGNATKFACSINPNHNPDYISATAGKVETTVLKTYTPFTLPSALHDQLGFGMAARAAVTPAYFLIPVDAEYNTETKKIKLFINEALVDFLPTIFNSQVFVQWTAGLPLLRRMDYPVSKARLTINAALKNQSEFDVQNDAKLNPFISKTVNRTINGDNGNLHSLEFIIALKKQ